MEDLKKSGKIEENTLKLFRKSPVLKKVLTILNKNNIKYGIFAGACVSLLTSNRQPTDIDILVADEDMQKLSAIFKGKLVKKRTDRVMSELFYLDDESILEFVTKLDFIVDGKSFPIRVTKLAWENALHFKVQGVDVILLNPVDTLLEKAIDPREKEVGKHDLDDIEALAKNVDLNKVYLKKRVKEMKAEDQIANILHKFHII